MSGAQQLLASYGGERDPYFSNVVLLMHMDGANGSTTFTDSSSSAKTMSAVGSPTISTSQSKWGGSSLVTSGSSQGVKSASSLSDFNFGSGDFTLEAWEYCTSITPTNAIFRKAVNSSVMSPFGLFREAFTGYPRFWASTDGVNWDIQINPSTLYVTGAWHFWQVTRSGSTFTLRVNGTSLGTATNAGALFTNTAALCVACGAEDGVFSHNGYIDDVRITKGVARANLVPTGPFPNS